MGSTGDRSRRAPAQIALTQSSDHTETDSRMLRIVAARAVLLEGVGWAAVLQYDDGTELTLPTKDRTTADSVVASALVLIGNDAGTIARRRG
jgi:hypothetical protein